MYVFILFCLGLIIGSFLNVVIARYNSGLSVFKGRSVCFSCGKTLTAFELIPLFSFLIQRAKCRVCGSKISWRYPAIELLTAILFVGLYLKLVPISLIDWLFFVGYGVIISILVVISGYDLKHKIIPNSFSYTFSGLSLFLGLLSYLLIANFQFLPYLLSGPIFAFVFFFLWLITRGRGMGFGDVKLVLGIGWFLGLSSGISAIMLAFWIGAIVSLSIMAFQRVSSRFTLHASRSTFKSEVPFGPYLVLGTLLAFFFNIDFGTISSWLSFGV